MVGSQKSYELRVTNDELEPTSILMFARYQDRLDVEGSNYLIRAAIKFPKGLNSKLTQSSNFKLRSFKLFNSRSDQILNCLWHQILNCAASNSRRDQIASGIKF